VARLLSPHPACRPACVFGEQVAGKAGYGWLDGVRADLAGEGYASRGVDIPACAMDAPHRRSRIYWFAKTLADASCSERRTVSEGRTDEFNRTNAGGKEAPSRLELDCAALGDAYRSGLAIRGSERSDHEAECASAQRAGRQPSCALADAESLEQWGNWKRYAGADGESLFRGYGSGHGALGEPDSGGREAGKPTSAPMGHGYSAVSSGRNGTFWSDAEWIAGADRKSRRVGVRVRRVDHGLPAGMDSLRPTEEAAASVHLLSHGEPARVGKLKALGNAIVPQLAAEVIRAFMQCSED
jgi:DNA (cytosine-5)-methyltransferase 1